MTSETERALAASLYEVMCVHMPSAADFYPAQPPHGWRVPRGCQQHTAGAELDAPCPCTFCLYYRAYSHDPFYVGHEIAEHRYARTEALQEARRALLGDSAPEVPPLNMRARLIGDLFEMMVRRIEHSDCADYVRARFNALLPGERAVLHTLQTYEHFCEPLLHLAARHRRNEVVRLLLHEYRLPPDVHDACGMTALVKTAIRGGPSDTIVLLVTSGARPERAKYPFRDITVERVRAAMRAHAATLLLRTA